MKIEKINENQIKCTIDKNDLSVRGISISELAYGSENTKSLFSEIMSQAFSEFGFTSDDTPLIIEAIPLATGSLVLIVSKESEPEELDTRFSKFSPEASDREEDGFRPLSVSEQPSSEPFWTEELSEEQGSDSEAFIPLPKIVKDGNEEKGSGYTKNTPFKDSSLKIYVFNSLSTICDLAAQIGKHFHGASAVYKDKDKHTYYLILDFHSMDKDALTSLTSFLAEYATAIRGNYATLSYITEHYEPIVKEDALIVLSAL